MRDGNEAIGNNPAPPNPATSLNVVGITPINNSINYTIGTPITILFNKPIDLSSLTIIGTNGPCGSNVQISTDNFATCLGGTVTLSPDSLAANITLTIPLCVETTYTIQVKVTSAVKDTTGITLASTYTSSTSFQTQPAFVKVGVSGGTNTVSALAYSCNFLFVGGNFTTLGASSRNNLGVIDLVTGNESSVNMGTNGAVTALLAYNGLIYIGGSFTNAGGQPRNNGAAIDPRTGAATPWNPNASGQINAIVQNGTTAYVGGAFTTIGGQARNRIAEIDLNTGNATAWNPNANTATINAIAYDATNVYLGGSFTSITIGGQTFTHLAAVDRTTGNGLAGWCGTATTFPVNALLLTGGVLFVGGAFGGNLCNLVIYNFGGLVPSTAANGGYPMGGGTGAGNAVKAFSVYGNNLYVGGIFSGAGSFFSNVRNYLGSTSLSGVINSWDPNAAGGSNGVTAMVVIGSGIVVAGDFTTINGGTAKNRLAFVDTNTGALRP